MRFLKRTRISLREEGGFSLAEVLIAGLILAVSVIPMVGMFDGAFKISMASYDINMSEDCLLYYSENVRNLPFYQPHDDDHPLGTAYDVDDHYWGRPDEPDTARINNNFSEAPYVMIKDFDQAGEPYPNMKVDVKMSFIDDVLVSGRSLEEAANLTILDSFWVTEDLYGKDRPLTLDGKTLNLILYEIRVETDGGRVFENTEIYSAPTDVLANIYLDKVINVDGNDIKLGTHLNGDDECDSAPHDQNDITVRAYGEGFDEGQVQAGLVDVKLVRVDDADVQLDFNPLTAFGSDAGGNYIEGTIDLKDSKSAKEPWSWEECRAPGFWHAWLVVDHIISVRNNAFVMEYPQPVYHATPVPGFSDTSGDKQGQESEDNETITFTNVDYTTEFNPVEYGSVGAIIQLVHSDTEADGTTPIAIINGSNFAITDMSNHGYQPGLTASSDFDFRGYTGGRYKLRIINCIDRSTPEIDVPGNTYFEVEYDPLDPDTYYELEGPPRVDEAYVYEETPTSPELRHFAFEDRQYNYTLEIKGYNFDDGISLDDVWLGYEGDMVSEPPVGESEVVPIGVVREDEYTVRATFDFLPSEVNGYYGKYWVYVRNNIVGTNIGELKAEAFEVLQPAPIIYEYDWATDPLGRPCGPWQNYFWQGMLVYGECFDYDEMAGEYIEVRINDRADLEDPPQAQTDWLATEAMDDPVVSDLGRQIGCHVNLVDCDVRDWELYVISKPADMTSNNYTDHVNGVEYTSIIPIDVGVPILLTDDVPAAGEEWSLSITSHYKDWHNYGTEADPDWQWTPWFGWQTSTEGNGQRAWSEESDPEWPEGSQTYRTMGEMYFPVLRGMGFEKGGTISVHAQNNDVVNRGPGMDATWNDVPVLQDRSLPQVWIEMDETDVMTTGPDEGGFAQLRLMNDSLGTWGGWYVDRFRFEAE